MPDSIIQDAFQDYVRMVHKDPTILSIDEYEAMRATFFAGMAVALEWDATVIRRELAEYIAAKKAPPKEKLNA